MPDGDEKIRKDEMSSSGITEQTKPVVKPNVWLESTLTEGRDHSNTKISPKHKIQKVSHVIRPHQKCYDPLVISIGPYHRRKEELKPMEKIKKCLTWQFVNRCNGTSAESIYNTIAGLADEARNCYADRLDHKDFAQMMFLDGCFLLEFIFCRIEGKEKELKLKNHDIVFIQHDLFLLENQLPFIVLKALMGFTSFGEKEGFEKIKQFIRNFLAVPPPPESFREKVENFIANDFRCSSSNHVEEEAAAVVKCEDDPTHLLELVRREIINPNAFENKTQKDSIWYLCLSVQELKAAGIIFRPNRSQRNLLTDVRYEPLFVRAVLRLPVMTFDESTKPLLLNLVAYEMCPDSPNDFGVSSYLWLMNTLIDSPDDVKELRLRGVLFNFLASDERVAKIFNEIADNVVPHSNAYANVKRQMEKHHKNRVKVWITEFLHTHFNTPWTILAFTGAIIAIALSLIKTYYAIKRHH